MNGGVATPAAELPTIDLPDEALGTRLFVDGHLVQLFLVQDRRPNHTFYYVRARAGSKKWTVARLGTDLQLSLVDAYRQAVREENQWRRSPENCEDILSVRSTS